MADPIYKDANEHIKLLASDYKCYDNTLTHEEAVELCNMLETKTAHWIKEVTWDDEFEKPYNTLMCSCCYHSLVERETPKYCENCGAKMESEG